jgi:hypothetical protein
LNEVAIEKNFAFICVLGKLLAMPDHKTGQWCILEGGQDTFLLFASNFLHLMARDTREVHLKADSLRYIEVALRAASQVQGSNDFKISTTPMPR